MHIGKNAAHTWTVMDASMELSVSVDVDLYRWSSRPQWRDQWRGINQVN
jgi:hypothetical protein